MEPKKGFIHFLMNPKKWWIPLTFIFVVSFTGVGLIGYETYYEAPPIPNFVNEAGDPVFTENEILEGQFARSDEFIEQKNFQTLTWLRIIGGSVFTLGGVLPLVNIVIKSSSNLKNYSQEAAVREEPEMELMH